MSELRPNPEPWLYGNAAEALEVALLVAARPADLTRLCREYAATHSNPLERRPCLDAATREAVALEIGSPLPAPQPTHPTPTTPP